MSSHDSPTQTAPGLTLGSGPAGKTPPLRPGRSTSSLAVTQTVAAPASARLARIQWIVALVMVAIGLLAGVRLWMIEGLVRAARVDGPSMAPAYLGAHYRVTCEDCGFGWRCDAEHAPASREASCPNCGYPTNSLRDEDLAVGERVLIDHWPVAVRGVRPGEVVAAADPAHPGGIVIKRVVALPGQRVEIRSGDLYLDGRLVAKSWREIAQMRVLVHDNSFQPMQSAGVPDRWQGAAGERVWHAAMTGFACQPTDGEQWRWLEYRHHQMFGWHSRTRLSTVLDLDSYNPSQTRLLNSVPDVFLSCRVRNLSRAGGQFALAAIDGDMRFEAVIDPEGQTAELASIDGRGRREILDREPRILLDIGRRGVEIDFGLCDQQVFLRLAGRQLFRHPYKRSGVKRETLHPLAIGSRGLALAVEELRVWRDVYYLSPDGTGNDWTLPPAAAADSLALLGDNTSVSVDSRHWPTGIAPGSVRGLVYHPFWSRR